MHTYNTQEALREAINAAFSREVDSLVSLCQYLYILSKVCLLLVFLSFLSMPLGFTCQMLGATYVRLLLAGNHSPLPIPLPSAVSELFSGISSGLSISVPRQNMWSCFIKHVLRIVPGLGVRTHNLRSGPNNKTFYKHTYIDLPRFRLHTAWSLASLPTRQLTTSVHHTRVSRLHKLSICS